MTWARGVYFGVAPQGVETFVLVDRLAHGDEDNCFGTAAGEMFLYLVKAVTPGTATDGARAAAVRIREALEGATITIAEYALQRPIAEVESVRITEVDEGNPDRKMQHWGGHYEVHVQRLTPARRAP